MVEIGSHTTTERVDMVTLHLRDARAQVLPDGAIRVANKSGGMNKLTVKVVWNPLKLRNGSRTEVA